MCVCIEISGPGHLKNNKHTSQCHYNDF